MKYKLQQKDFIIFVVCLVAWLFIASVLLAVNFWSYKLISVLADLIFSYNSLRVLMDLILIFCSIILCIPIIVIPCEYHQQYYKVEKKTDEENNAGVE